MRSVKLIGDVVYKIDPKLNDEWKEKLQEIMKYMGIPAFEGFIEGGYKTRYIDGFDLQEDRPFKPRHDIVRAFPLTTIQKKRVLKIFKDIVYAGIKTGYTLADFTKRNIILEGMTPYLIDYDVIIEDFNKDYIDLFQKMIDYLEIDYKFDGNLHALYKVLGGEDNE